MGDIPKEEDGRNAIKYIARDIKEHEQKRGKEITSEEAHRRAKEIAERAEKRTIRRSK